MATVVVAEDNVEHQHVIGAAVRRAGHHVIVVADGRAGLDAVRRHRPDLVIADVDMPHMDGLEMCERLRADPDLAGIPIVLVTGYLSPADPMFSSAGVAVVVSKPFTLAELAAAVRAGLDAGDPAGPAPSGPGADLRACPEFLDALVQSLDTGVAACDANGRLVVFNRTLQTFIGDHLGAVLPITWPDGFTLCDHDGTPLPADQLPLTRALAGADVRGAQVRVDDPQHRHRWFEINARAVRDPRTRTVAGAVAAVHDVTAQHCARRYQDCLSEVLRILAATPDTTSVGGQVMRAVATSLRWPYVRLWLVDPVTDRLRPAGTYTAPGETPLPIPDSFARGVGLAGLAWERGELVWVPDIQDDDAPILPQVAAATTHRAAGAVPLRSGDTITGVMTFFAAERQEADPGLAVLLSGIAGNLGAYLENRRAEELALHLAASTDEYIALAGHDLRTPLTSISTYADLIAESPDDTPLGEVRDLLDVVIRNNTRLRGLVDDLLDLAALESGHATMATDPVDLAGVVRAAVDALPPSPVTVEVRLPDRPTVIGDADRLRQVADHVLRNAVGYSPGGGTVTVELETANGCAVLTVADTGMGVPAEERELVFRRLYRSAGARHGGTTGSGLGLALCRVVVDRHHGTITLQPRRPQGTTVTVRLPCT
ncbi:hybrid sensor histidine kinase/response regulator [Jidongwangia harbinensis]|uniref:hybrid sensor histidine kinase/response regulator n=1 Tax=Jidongwangia harbinensis TaxID=2878561 RepID=UPI001CD946D5|nr:ATP-binding protein [Jidongwangia harbinensis]MCA2214980.1 response regulator [Jidongwangia harbinensis]